MLLTVVLEVINNQSLEEQLIWKRTRCQLTSTQGKRKARNGNKTIHRLAELQRKR